MPTIYIDNTAYAFVAGDRNVLEVCLSLGLNVPFFCWHPAMRSVGACRQCAVKVYKDEHDTRGKIMMSCMTPATDGMRISIDDPDVVAFRAHVIEWLMVNHPHDCPVCDEGGECHLQDMTVMTGHTYRQYRFSKRTYANQYLGPFINHEMNRCIQCYRCVRFYRHYAGGRDFDVFGCHDHVYFGRQHDGVLENPFSGNLVEVCPTGVFTDKTQARHYTRKWDLQTAPSICTLCGMGCNTIPGERYRTLRRIRNRFNREINGYFLCDRGRFGYEFVNSADRLRQPLVQGEPVAVDAALQHLSGLLRAGTVVGIGSPRASVEDNFALRTLVGEGQFCHGLTARQARLQELMVSLQREGGLPAPTLLEVEGCDAVLVLGEDVPNTAPRLELALRQAVKRQPASHALAMGIHAFDETAIREVVQQGMGQCFIATPAATRLDDQATGLYRAAPDDIARLGFAVAHAIQPDAPAVTELPEENTALVARISTALQGAKAPLIVAGYGTGSDAVVQAAANVTRALQAAGKAARLFLTAPECNSVGVSLLGGMPLDDVLAQVRAGKVETLVLLEPELPRDLDATSVETLLGVPHLVVLAPLPTAVTAHAEVVLPASTFAESDGTLVNYEGRAQRFFQVFVPEGEVRAGWRWLGDVMEPANPWPVLDAVTAAAAAAVPALAGIVEAAPDAEFRITGQKIARQTHRNSGRTAIFADRTMHEPKPPADADSPLAFSMEGYQGQPPAALVPRFWAPGWNSEQALHKFQDEVDGPLHGGTPGVRLFAASAGGQQGYLGTVPVPFTPKDGQVLLLPAYHLFGSEPYSRYTPGIGELTLEPYLAISAADADRLRVQEGDRVVFTINGVRATLPVRVSDAVATGVAMYPVGLPDMPAIALPCWAQVAPESGVTP